MMTCKDTLKLFSILILAFAVSSCNQQKENKDNGRIVGEYEAELTYAPNVPASPGYERSQKVIINLEIIEKIGRLADGVEYTFWTFGGEVPGPFMRVREGDLVEFHLHNHPDNKLPHNIDLHAVTGPGGGAEASMTAPGRSTQFSFKTLNPGLYIYHCAVAPVGMHIANGMYGLIYVEPKEGLPPVDKEFYILQSEFYTKAPFGQAGLTSFDMAKALAENPDYVVFNGSVGAAMGDNAMQVNVGETVRLYVGNAGPSLISSFHVIGEIFDKVYLEGGSLVNTDVQSTMIPVGGAAIIEFKCEVPGSLTVVDHSIFRAFNKGAIAQINVVGEEDHDVFSGKQKDIVYQPEGSAIQSITPAQAPEPIPERTFEERMVRGKTLFETNCAACHQINGEGLPPVFPPVANSDYLMAQEDKGIGIILHGLSGEITVNGVKYDNVMPSMQLGDDEIASILTYIRNSWNNKGDLVTAQEVNNVRHGR